MRQDKMDKIIQDTILGGPSQVGRHQVSGIEGRRTLLHHDRKDDIA